MFKFPTGCDRASCSIYAQWTPTGNDTIEFELEGAAEGWVAVGVSADQRMGTDGIDDVFACQRDAMNDTVYAQDMYNPENQSPRANRRDSVSVLIQLEADMASKLYFPVRVTPTLRTKLVSNW